MDGEMFTYYLGEATAWMLGTGVTLGMQLLGGLIILAVAWFIAGWVNRLVIKALDKAKLDVALGRFLGQLARYAVLVGGGVSALATMGFEVTTFVAVLGAAGFAVGLALQGTLGHFASGVLLLVFRPFTIGDVIEIAGSVGLVHEIGLFATTLITPDSRTITVPNGAVTGGVITNITASGLRRAEIDVGVAYGSDLKQVQDVCVAVAKAHELVLDDPAIGFAFVAMNASSLDFKLMCWCKPQDFLTVLHDVRSGVYNALNENKIEIPFPQVVVHRAEG